MRIITYNYVNSIIMKNAVRKFKGVQYISVLFIPRIIRHFDIFDNEGLDKTTLP